MIVINNNPDQKVNDKVCARLHLNEDDYTAVKSRQEESTSYNHDELPRDGATGS